MTRDQLQPRLRQKYQRDQWLETLRAVLPATELFAQPQTILVEPKSAKAMCQLGRVRLQGGRQLAILEIEVTESVDLVRNRVGLRRLVARMIDQAEYHGVLAVFHSREPDFRFTFAARESFFGDDGQIQRRETAARRYTYVLGPNEPCRTAAERFAELAGKAHDATLDDVISAFSVEKLNKEFFADFIRIFDRVAKDIRSRHHWSETAVQAEAQMLLNRLLFLYFVQRKGWLNRQRDYLVRNFRERYAAAPQGTSYYTEFLQPLFQRLSTESPTLILTDHDVPFLNGGLFNDEYGDEQSDEAAHRRSQLCLSNETFQTVFEDLLERYNFTIYEDSPSHYEVAIDPEMLGRIFEAVVLQEEASQSGGKSLRHDTGSHYTPRPIVHYLCRESLAAWIESHPPFSDVGLESPPRSESALHDSPGGIISPKTAGQEACTTPSRQRIDALLRLDASEGIDEPSLAELDRLLTPEEAAKLRDRLLELRACDPAVGSGAFPMGLLHELLNLLRLCETRARGQDPVEGDRHWLYHTKKRIIERVIYGVDIQDRAIEICRLRLWLSLMVDHDLGANPFKCERRAFQGALRKLEPLPNLDFKIRRANSLRDTLHGEAVNLCRWAHGASDGLGRSRGLLIDAKRNFYAARKAEEKRLCRLEIYDCLSEMADFHLNQVRNDTAGLILNEGDESKVADVHRLNLALTEVRNIRAQIRDARRAKSTLQTKALERLQAYYDDEKTPTFVWELDFAEVFFRQPPPLSSGDSLLPDETRNSDKKIVKRGGFDLMLGNPPYVRIQTLKKQSVELADYYKDRYRSAGKGNFDLYVCFVERGLELLADQGQLAYILPHKFFNARYGEPLRGLISRPVNLLRHVVHFGDQQVFPGATNYVCLLFLAKAGATDGCRFVAAENKTSWLRSLQGITGKIPAKEIKETEWNFVVGRSGSIFDRLKAMPIKLRTVSDIFVGLQTSADKIYVVEAIGKPRASLLRVRTDEGTELELESGILKRFLLDVSLRPFSEPSGKHCLIFPYELSMNGATLFTQERMCTEYPAAWDYLQRHAEALKSRDGGAWDNAQWYAFGRSQSLTLMREAKLIVQVLAQNPRFAHDPNGYYFTGGGNGPYYGVRWASTEEKRSIHYLQGVLNSRITDFYIRNTSTPFHGDYWSYGKRFIENLPIPALDLKSAEERTRHDTIVSLVEWLLWLNAQPSVSESTREHPRDPLMAAYFEQWVNALVYELYFPIELHAASLQFFTLSARHPLPSMESIPPAQRLKRIRDVFETLYDINHPLRAALFGLGSLETVRIIEGKE